MSTRHRLLIVATTMSVARLAHAEDEIRGHFPLLRAGVIAGFSSVPIPTDDPDYPQTKFGGVVGADLHAHIDARIFLLNFEGVFNALSSDLWWGARGQLVLGAGLGGRSYVNVIKSMSQTQSGSTVTTTTEWYTHKKLPMFYGLHVGANILGLRESTSPDYASVQSRRDAATLPTVDAGFTLMSPQLEVMIAPCLDLNTSAKGLRWAYGMAFPLGNKPFFFRFTGDHFFGSDPMDGSGRRLGFSLLVSLGLGTSMGIHK